MGIDHLLYILHESNDETKHRSIQHNRSPDFLKDTQELNSRDSESTFSSAQGMINCTVFGARKVSVIMVLPTKLSRSLQNL